MLVPAVFGICMKMILDLWETLYLVLRLTLFEGFNTLLSSFALYSNATKIYMAERKGFKPIIPEVLLSYGFPVFLLPSYTQIGHKKKQILDKVGFNRIVLPVSIISFFSLDTQKLPAFRLLLKKLLWD